MSASVRLVLPPLGGITPALPWKPCSCVLDQRRLALSDARRPSGLVAEFRRADKPRRVADVAGAVIDLLAIGVAAGRGHGRRHPGSSSGCRSGRSGGRGCGGGGRSSAGRGYLEAGSCEIRHVDDGAMDFVVGQVRVAALGGHHARLALEPGERMLEQNLLTLRDARAPRGLVACLGRAREARLMAGFAHLREHLLAGQVAFRTRRFRHDDAADGLDPGDDRVLAPVPGRAAAGHQLRQQSQERDGDREGEQDDDDELLG